MVLFFFPEAGGVGGSVGRLLMVHPVSVILSVVVCACVYIVSVRVCD